MYIYICIPNFLLSVLVLPFMILLHVRMYFPDWLTKQDVPPPLPPLAQYQLDPPLLPSVAASRLQVLHCVWQPEPLITRQTPFISTSVSIELGLFFFFFAKMCFIGLKRLWLPNRILLNLDTMAPPVETMSLFLKLLEKPPRSPVNTTAFKNCSQSDFAMTWYLASWTLDKITNKQTKKKHYWGNSSNANTTRLLKKTMVDQVSKFGRAGHCSSPANSGGGRVKERALYSEMWPLDVTVSPL